MTKFNDLQLPTASLTAPKSTARVAVKMAILAAVATVMFIVSRRGCNHFIGTEVPTATVSSSGPQCVQLDPLVPTSDPSLSLERLDAQFLSSALHRLSEAVQIPTVSYDNMTNVAPIETEHSPFIALHNNLQNNFPLVHKTLRRDVINKHSLLYTWQGTVPHKKPLVLMAHLDVVPVLPETAVLWTHPPFSGFIDKHEGKLWGRGAADTKATVLGILEAVEQLLKAGFETERTVYLAFGHDEEISGHQGAKKLAQYLEHELGLKGKVGLIIDEGTGLSVDRGIPVAVVGTGEKGYVDVSITVETKGGHSSVPPKHTGIGYSALLIAELEANPYPISLSDNNPVLGATRCYVAHSPKPDSFIKWAVEHLDQARQELADTLASESANKAGLLTTTQAIDVIQGGLKVNALPEKVTTIVNHRIARDSSLKGTQDHMFKILKKEAAKNALNLIVEDFADSSRIAYNVGVAGAVGKVTVSPTFEGLEPSPLSPSNGDRDIGWNVLEGTIHHVFDKEHGGNFGKVIVGPNMMNGNTDTRHYWGLSQSIYRFGPTGGQNVHTVDEHINAAGYLNAIKFYHELIRNWSEAQ